MIRISQLKLPAGHTEKQLYEKAARTLRVPEESLRALTVVKRSIDARKKDQIFFIYTLDAEVAGEKESKIIKRAKNVQVALAADTVYHFPEPGNKPLSHPPVIVGSGPAGLFAGYMLAEAGYRPVILERGDEVSVRRRKVERFWQEGILDIRSNVQFGEGGAGTFSDGKLNTMVKDPDGRNRKVLEILAEHGAGADILWDARPHIGTDVLAQVVKNLREHIISLGGTVMFGTRVTELLLERGRVTGVKAEVYPAGRPSPGESRVRPSPDESRLNPLSDISPISPPQEIVIPAEAVILAIGHSARDTFAMLERLGVPMQAKSFAVGLRIQHPQRMINESQYGCADPGILGSAPYKLTHQAGSGRGVYSFCMCPGGYVVDASSEPGRLAVNGMSNHDRAGVNANSALIVTVSPADYGSSSPLAGVEFQRRLEEKAYHLGNGRIPVQLYGDFKAGRASRDYGGVCPQFMGRTEFADLREILPDCLTDALIEGVESFEQKIAGFSRYDAILAGVESRTSSPVRILRDGHFESAVAGLFPCGEGAGYAGGITSAAMDGMKTAEEIARRYAPVRSYKGGRRVPAAPLLSLSVLI